MARAALIWAGALAIGAAFLGLDFAYGADFFPRGGCLMAGYGVILGAYALKSREAYGQALDLLQSEQLQLAQLLHKEAGAAARDATRIETQIERLLKAGEARMAALRASAERLTDLRRVEGPIILLGTLIWGFGDLAVAAAR